MIYTFYSFKGGVGRSMALANVAEIHCRRGLRVLMVDFDLEAPGLERYFAPPEAETRTSLEDMRAHRGVIDLLDSYKSMWSLAGTPRAPAPAQFNLDAAVAQVLVEPLERFIVPISGPNARGGTLSLIPAGRRDASDLDQYGRRVLALDWDDSFAHQDGELFFEWFRRQAQADCDVVLIDSRTA